MRFWYFTEGAYPYLPPEDTYDSIRVTLPNKHMDPVRHADLWHRYLDEWKIAEECGFGIMLNEHHSTATCVNPAVPLIAAILARETTTARIVVLGNPIANRPDPVRVAEEMALVDVISRGRLECGFVRGVPYEISATNTDPVAMSERFWEAHDLIVKAWTSHDGPFSWTGDFFEHRQVNIWPRPYQQPHPPIWITTINPASAARIAEHRYTVATVLQKTEVTGAIFDNYRNRAAELGHAADPSKLAYCGLVYVGSDEASARRGAEEVMWYARSNKTGRPFQAPPGYMPPQARLKALSGGADPNALRHLTAEQMVEQNILFYGTPDQVYRQFANFYERVGPFGNFMIMGQAGFLNHEDTVSSMRLFSQEVGPRIQKLAPETGSGRLVA